LERHSRSHCERDQTSHGEGIKIISRNAAAEGRKRKSRMRICFIGNADSIHLRNWIDRFLKSGHEIHVLSYRPAELSRVDFHLIPASRTRSKHLNVIRRMYWIHRTLRRIKPDIINVHYITVDAIAALRANTSKVVLSFWGSDVFVEPNSSMMKRLVLRYLVKHTDLINSVAEYMTDGLISMGADEDKIVTLQYGVDSSFFKSPERLPSRETTVISTRALEKIYNIDLLIKSIPAVAQSIALKVLIIGEGSRERQLKELVNNLGLAQIVGFIGPVSHAQMPDYLNSADIYVSTSFSEGASLSLLEAMACGVFPIVSNIPANKEWITSGKNGFLVSLDDFAELAKSIVEASRNAGLRRKAAEVNRKMVEQKGSADRNFAILEDCFKNLLAEEYSVGEKR